MDEIANILSEFSQLTKLSRSKALPAYQDKLENAYRAGERIIQFRGSATGLGEAGGRLLGEFIRRHPDMVEISIPGNWFYNPRSPHDMAGFQAFIAGLAETRTAGTLRTLDLSNCIYSPECLRDLAKDVIAGHPSLISVTLDATSMEDKHLALMLPHLSSPILRTINLRSNRLRGACLPALVDQLLSGCPSLSMLDLSTNDILLENTPSLHKLLSENPQVFVRIPEYREFLTASLRNHYEHYMPSRISIMTTQFDDLVAKFDCFDSKIRALPDDPEDSGARQQIKALNERIQQMTEEMNKKNGDFLRRLLLQDVIQTGKTRYVQDSVSLQAARIDAVSTQQTQQQTQLESMNQSILSFRATVASTEIMINELSERIKTVASSDKAMAESLAELQLTVVEHSDAIQDLEQAVAIIDQLQTKLSELPETTQTLAVSDLSPEHQTYVDHFKKILIRMHMTAMIASTGLVPITASGNLGKAGRVLDAVSGCAPLGAGLGIKMLSYLLQAADQRMVMQRMERLSALGTTPEDIGRLSEALSMRLVRCLTIENPVQDQHIAQLLSATADMVTAVDSNGFYGALTQVFESHVADALVDKAVTTPTQTQIEKRAEQDAQLLLAFIAENRELHRGPLDMDRLFLSAVPLITLVNQLFTSILDQFCQKQSCYRHELECKGEKRAKFYAQVTRSWHSQAAFIASSLEDTSQRERLIAAAADGFSVKQHADHSLGLFYFKEDRALKVPFMKKRYHVSMHNAALEPDDVDDVLRVVMG